MAHLVGYNMQRVVCDASAALRVSLVGHGTMIFVLSIAGGILALILMMSLALIF